MPRPSSVSTRRDRSVAAYRAASILFGAVTVFVGVLFARALGEGEIRSGLLTYALMTAAAALGLWRRRRWGRSVALLFALGNAGLGTLALLSVILAGRGPLLGPVLLLVGSVALAYILSRPLFVLPDEG